MGGGVYNRGMLINLPLTFRFVNLKVNGCLKYLKFKSL